MSQVSGRATRLLVEAAELYGVDRSVLVRGVPLTPEQLTRTRHRIPWNLYVDVVANLEVAVGGVNELESVGFAMARAPSYGFFRTAAQYVVSTRMLHEIGARYVAPALISDLPLEVLESTDRRVVLRCVLPPAWRSSRAFFHLTKGSMSSLSTLLGLPPSLVEGTITDRAATYEISIPDYPHPRRNLVRRTRAWLAGVPISDLMDQQDAVNDSLQEVLRTRREFRDLLERAPMAAGIHRDQTIVWANAEMARMLGWEHAGDLVGLSVLPGVHPDDRARVAERLAMAPEDMPTEEVRMLRRDKTVAIFEIAAAQSVVFEGDPARLVVGMDVTERKRARERLAVADRMAAVGMLAAGVAHEINNPLTYVMLNVQLMARELEGSSNDGVRGAAATALEGLARVQSIVADLRTFARSDEQVGPVDVNDVIRGTLRLAQKTVGVGATLEVDLQDVPPVRANHGRIGQVVLNVLLNAHEAIEERGGNGKIRVASWLDGARNVVVVEVGDNGIGLPRSTIARAFEPFFTTKIAGRGTGLGLAICHRIVAELGGNITLESNVSDPDETVIRTVVRISLPALDGAAVTPAPEIDTRTPPQVQRRRVLVIDDDASVRGAIAIALGGTHDVETVAGGGEALALLARDSAFDVILCDVMMPGIDGVQVYERIRSSSEATARRFVFMTGGAFSVRARGFIAECTNLRIEKPFDAEQLFELVERASELVRKG